MRRHGTSASRNAPRKMSAADPPVMPHEKRYGSAVAPSPAASAFPTISSKRVVMRLRSSAIGATTTSMPTAKEYPHLARHLRHLGTVGTLDVRLFSMPPRHAYWTIIVDDQPTSFRAHDVEELLPTFN